uniref:AlNc14C28G2733 protein n=1 Tax=Albugo laibachii Nc14 TaxID=890382 RepID=F0W7B3_9STRA|nr:AlNc14C28G2733 [Albugo laibachii Nc14]|eukprot:CCA17012.1 AlNc14C28G2733 [Albugo laibachii Nc14]
MTRIAALNKAMKELQMKTNMDGGSRVDTLVQDFMDILDELNMENFDREEPKACVKEMKDTDQIYQLAWDS